MDSQASRSGRFASRRRAQLARVAFLESTPSLCLGLSCRRNACPALGWHRWVPADRGSTPTRSSPNPDARRRSASGYLWTGISGLTDVRTPLFTFVATLDEIFIHGYVWFVSVMKKNCAFVPTSLNFGCVGCAGASAGSRRAVARVVA